MAITESIRRALTQALSTDFDGREAKAVVDAIEIIEGVLATNPGGGGNVETVTSGSGIFVDSTDVNNPIVSVSGPTQASLTLANTALQPLANITSLNNNAGYTTNTGTVTSINLGASTGLTPAGGPVTGAGSLSYSLSPNLLAWHALTTATKADSALTISTSAPLTGGGNLTANRNLSITPATTSAAGSMSAADKLKLDGISGGATTSRNTVTAVSSASGIVTLNYALGDYFTLALTENVTGWVITNPPGSGKGFTLMVQITQGSPARTVAIPGTTPGSAPLDVTATNGAVDILAISSFNNSSTLRSTITKNFGSGGTFDSYYAPGFQLVSNTTYSARPAQGRPATKSTGFANANYTTAFFGTRVQRVTDVTDTPTALTFLRHDYSRRQAFNCDSTRRLALGSNTYFYLYDVATNARLDGGGTVAGNVGALGQGASYRITQTREAIWHPTDPNKIWYTEISGSGALNWREFDIVSKISSLLFTINATTLSGLGMAGVTYTTMSGEGRPSDDGRYWCLKAMASGTYRGTFVYDRQTNTYLGALPGTAEPNWVGMSPSGTYAMVAWSNAGNISRATCAVSGVNTSPGTRAYNRAMTSFTQVSNISGHGDLGYATDGTEVWVGVDHSVGMMPSPCFQGCTYMASLADGSLWLLPVDVYDGDSHNIHISCTARNKPGFALMSMIDDGTAGGSTTYDESVFIVKLAKSGAGPVYRIGHHQSRPGADGYWDEVHATWNNDGNMILWASNNGDGSDRIEDYMVGLPNGCYS